MIKSQNRLSFPESRTIPRARLALFKSAAVSPALSNRTRRIQLRSTALATMNISSPRPDCSCSPVCVIGLRISTARPANRRSPEFILRRARLMGWTSPMCGGIIRGISSHRRIQVVGVITQHVSTRFKSRILWTTYCKSR